MELYEDIGNAPGQVYDFLKRKFVSLTKPDEEGDYSSRKGSISRQQKLAEMLSQMGAQEQAVSTAGGITAPISGMGALARGLTSFGGAYLSGKAERDAAALDKASLKDAADKVEALYTLGGIEGGTFKLGGPPTEPLAEPQNKSVLQMRNIPDRSKVQPRDIGQTMPREITLGDVSLGARPYEDQQRLLREYRRSSDPNVRQMATEERALIEAERDRNQPKMVAAGANGVIDSNPNSPTYGELFAVPPPDDDKTTDIKNYNFAVSQGDTRPFPVWLAAQSEGRRPSTTVNVGPTGVNYGEPEAGLVWQRGPNNSIVLDARGAPIAIPYQGGKAYVEKETTEASSREAASNASTASSIVRSDIANARSIMKKSEMPVTGIIGSATKGIPGTQSRVLSGLLTTIKANVGFDKLQKMRAASPTGAALGPVSDFENKLLQAVVGDLEQSTTDDQLDRNLKRLDEVVYKIVDNSGKPVGKPGAAPGTSSGTTRRGKYDPATGKVVY